MTRPRHLVLVCVGLVATGAAVGPARAHGFGPGDGPVGLALVVGLAVGAGVVAGLPAALRGTDTGMGGGRLPVLLGPALVGLGALAAVTAVRGSLAVAGGCVLAGAVGTRAAARRFGHGLAGHREARANTVLGAVTAHRAVEGVSLVAVYRWSRPSASGLDPEGEGRKLG